MRNEKSEHRDYANILLIVVIAIFFICALFYIGTVNSALGEEAKKTITDVTQQNAHVIEKQMQGDLQTLSAIALWAETLPWDGGDHALELLEKVEADSPFKEIGVIMPDGTAYIESGMPLNLKHRDYFQKAMTGESVVTGMLADAEDGSVIYIYATPIWSEGQVTAVLFATNYAKDYAASLGIRPYEENGHSYVIDSSGKIMLSMQMKDPSGSIPQKSIFEILMENPKIQIVGLDALLDSLQNGEGGITECQENGEAGYISHTPLGVNDWQVISFVSARAVTSKSGYLNVLALMACSLTMTLLLGIFLYFRKIQQKNKQELERLAYLDPVTEGENRNGFRVRSRQLLSKASGTEYAIVNFDIDKFKVLNDLYGHTQGNRLLRHIWETLRDTLDEEEAFARVSADNFSLLMKYTEDQALVERLQNFTQRVAQGVEHDAAGYGIKFSFGVYHIRDKRMDINILSDRADIARKTIKGNHEQTVSFYDKRVRDRIIAEKNIENRMVEALELGEFQVYFQPKYSISTRRIVGAEALVRWMHPELGLIPPGDFIPIFERNGFLSNLDTFVLERTCEKLREWQKKKQIPVPVSVNVSRIQLHNPEFVQNVRDTCAQYEIPTALVQLELTESTVFDFQNIEVLIEIMRQLRAVGFTIAMDDFGTGHSSLNLLRRLPVDVLKLDREFFGACTDAHRGETVIADMVTMANHLDITVVAEGVETAEQVNFLRTTGCDIVQGFYFAKPMSLDAFDALLATEKQSNPFVVSESTTL